MCAFGKLALGCCLLALSASSRAAPEPIAPDVRVQIVVAQPDAVRYARPGADQAILLADLARYLERAARARLPAGSALTIVLTELDLAGRFEPWHRPEWLGVRIVRNVYSPRVSLRFALAGPDGRTAREGERIVRDSSAAVLGAPDLPIGPLRFEKLLLTAWIEQEFADRGEASPLRAQ